MSKHSEIRDFIRTVKPDAPDFASDQHLMETDVLDSVAMMELVLWSEEHFGFTVDMDDLTPENFATLDAIVAYVERMTGAG